MQAQMGTPRNMPATPHSPPPTRMATITQKPEIPVLLPRILGPRMLPSNCWRARMKRMKYRHLIGLSSRIRKALGMAPRNSASYTTHQPVWPEEAEAEKTADKP